MDPMIFAPNRLVWAWYSNWGVAVALLVALAAAAWVFYDAQRRTAEATLYKVVTVVAAILAIPSLALRISPAWASGIQNAVAPLAYLSILAGVAALLGLVWYAMSVGRAPAYTCPTCGREMHPSWERCPYCQPAMPTAAAPLPPTERVAEALPPTAAARPLEFEAQPFAPQPAPTVSLRREPTHLAWLVVRSGPRTGKEFRLGEASNIGRDATQNDVVIDDAALSRQHARIRLEHGQFVLYDLASVNGTFIKSHDSDAWDQIQKQALTDGDMIRMGETTFSFMQVGERKEA